MMRISNTKSDLKTINKTLVERKYDSIIYTLKLTIFQYLSYVSLTCQVGSVKWEFFKTGVKQAFSFKTTYSLDQL